MQEQIIEILGSFVRGSLVVIVESSLNACKEVIKFFLVLLILYCFAMRSFHLLDDLLLTTEEPSELEWTDEKQENFKIELNCDPHDTILRIGPPDETLIEQRADLLEQLEIEAEFEELRNKFIKTEVGLEKNVNKEIHNSAITATDSDETSSIKDLFIAKIKREMREISRPSQTVKTSLGKKSKLRDNSENRPTTSHKADVNNDEDEQLVENNINKVFEMGTEEQFSSAANNERPSYDEEHDYESFHRV